MHQQTPQNRTNYFAWKKNVDLTNFKAKCFHLGNVVFGHNHYGFVYNSTGVDLDLDWMKTMRTLCFCEGV